MVIREERAAEFGAIRELVQTAFKTAAVSCGEEQDFVERVRAGEAYVPELALVAEDGGELIGHIMLSRMAIDGPEGPYPLLLVAPLSVLLERRRQGVGSALMRESLRRARELGQEAVILVGAPEYYQRFGFVTAATQGILSTQGIPEENVMVYELVPGALAKISGTVTF